MINSNPAIVVIDPLSSARRYGQEIRSKGYYALAVITQKKFPERLRKLFGVDSFDEIIYVEDIEDAKNKMQERLIHAVIPGSDSALKVCDYLADHLGVTGNSIWSSKARVDKLEMKRKLQVANVRVAPAYALSVNDFIQGCYPDIPFPVVVKPRYGTGATNVKICESKSEVHMALEAIEFNSDSSSDDEQKALVEAFVEGVEYFIVTANFGEERRQIICFAEYDKLRVGQSPSIYRNIRSIPLDGELAQSSFDYIKLVNSALETDFGINDVEFKINSSGYYLIEQNGRLPGANVPRMIELCSGVNCYSLSIDIYLDHAPSAIKIPNYHKHFCICCLICDQRGEVVGVEGRELVESLLSFYELQFLIVEGDLISTTSDFLSTWGFVYLIHEDQEILKRECEIVHQCLRLNLK